MEKSAPPPYENGYFTVQSEEPVVDTEQLLQRIKSVWDKETTDVVQQFREMETRADIDLAQEVVALQTAHTKTVLEIHRRRNDRLYKLRQDRGGQVGALIHPIAPPEAGSDWLGWAEWATWLKLLWWAHPR